jgi:predicted Zn-dependent protease
MLVHGHHLEQATIEYALALHDVAQRRPLLEEITRAFPPKLAAAAISATEPVEPTVNMLVDLDRGDVANEWLIRVLAVSPGNLRACTWLYSVSTRTGDLDAALAASRLCRETAPSFVDRVKLGRLLLEKGRPIEAIAAVQDVESWSTRVNFKVDGWLVICDAYEAQHQLDEAKRCVRRLDASGLVTPERAELLTSRLTRIEAQQLGNATPR